MSAFFEHLLLALRLKHSQSHQGIFLENLNFAKAKTQRSCFLFFGKLDISIAIEAFAKHFKELSKKI